MRHIHTEFDSFRTFLFWQQTIAVSDYALMTLPLQFDHKISMSVPVRRWDVFVCMSFFPKSNKYVPVSRGFMRYWMRLCTDIIFSDDATLEHILDLFTSSGQGREASVLP